MTITRDSLLIFGGPDPPRRSVGRPKVASPRVPISTRITAEEYDQIAKQASSAGITVAAFMRSALRSALRPPR